MDEILKKLDAFLREQCAVEDGDTDFGPDTDLFDAGYMDSMGAVETVLFAEETFGVEITQKDITLHPMNTPRQIAAVIARKRDAK